MIQKWVRMHIQRARYRRDTIAGRRVAERAAADSARLAAATTIQKEARRWAATRKVHTTSATDMSVNCIVRISNARHNGQLQKTCGTIHAKGHRYTSDCSGIQGSYDLTDPLLLTHSWRGLQVAAMRADKQKWELLTAERDSHRSRTSELEAEVTRLKARRNCSSL